MEVGEEAGVSGVVIEVGGAVWKLGDVGGITLRNVKLLICN